MAFAGSDTAGDRDGQRQRHLWVVAFAVSQRRGKMATRLTLGATLLSVFRLVMKQGATLALNGTAIGLGVAGPHRGESDLCDFVGPIR